jgi:hypothetical protein
MKTKRVPYNKILGYLFIKFRRYLTSKERLLIDEREVRGKSMALKLITDPDSDLRICPETFVKYVRNEKLHAALIFNTSSIDFFDDYLHTINFCERNYRAITQVFNKHAAQDRKILDNEIRSQVKHSFDDMYNNIFKK